MLNNFNDSFNIEHSDKSAINNKLKNIIIILINFEKIKIKLARDLDIKNNFYNKYYLINSEWFNKYLELNNITEIYNYILSNGIIENIINNNQLPYSILFQSNLYMILWG